MAMADVTRKVERQELVVAASPGRGLQQPEALFASPEVEGETPRRRQFFTPPQHLSGGFNRSFYEEGRQDNSVGLIFCFSGCGVG